MTRKVCSIPVKELSVCVTNADNSRNPIDTIVLHTMVGNIESANARFNDPNSKVSAHYGVGSDGSIVHWVDEDWTAYQAGNYAMNQRSIGIEHEDNWNGQGQPPIRPDALYSASALLVADICKFYNIPCDSDHIIPHNQVVATGCPDQLDVNRIIKQANDIINPPPVIVDPDKVKVHIGINPKNNHDWGDMEVQAVRSTIFDQENRIASLEASIPTPPPEQPPTPPTVPPAPPTVPTPPSPTPVPPTLSWWQRLLKIIFG